MNDQEPSPARQALADRSNRALQAHYGCPWCFAGGGDLQQHPWVNPNWGPLTCGPCGGAWMDVSPAQVAYEHDLAWPGEGGGSDG